jgi:hypothetical protein
MAKWGTKPFNPFDDHSCNECGYLLDNFGECHECLDHYMDDEDDEEDEDDHPLAQQVGGSHYKDMAIQPIEFILANNLAFCEGNIIKYTCRYKQKNGVEDLRKVIHYAEMLIASIEEREQD